MTRLAKIIEPYINADDIKRTNHCTDLEAAQMAEAMRERCINEHKSFTFETVLSTDRNLKLLKKAKAEGYFIRCIYVLTCDSNINVARVKSREAQCKKRKTELFFWENENWDEKNIHDLVKL